MTEDTFQFDASDGTGLFCYRWVPEGTPAAVIHIAHGMGEHAERYSPFARILRDNNYAVIANDHRGHGKTTTRLGDFGPDGWNRMLLDLREMLDTWGEEFPNTPRVLLGHSMGALLAQQYLTIYAANLDAVILSGSPGFMHPLQLWIAHSFLRYRCWKGGPGADHEATREKIFSGANKHFEHETVDPTGFEWLSRDRLQVMAYVNDPLCGVVPTLESLRDMFAGCRFAQRKSNVANIPQVPILLVSGADDPVHNNLKNINRMLDVWRSVGLDPAAKFYSGGRHEMLNETNRDEVTGDILEWLAKTVSQ